MKKFALTKEERIKSFKIIEVLFKEGKSVKVFPFTIKWIIRSSDKARISVGFSVPKRFIKKAHLRNLIRRRIKEVLRKNKYIIIKPLHNNNIHIYFFIIYNTNVVENYTFINNKLVQTLHVLKNELLADSFSS